MNIIKRWISAFVCSIILMALISTVYGDAPQTTNYYGSLVIKYLNNRMDIDDLPFEALRRGLREYRDTLFKPYRDELVKYGCSDVYMLDFCSRVLYALEYCDRPEIVIQAGNKKLSELATRQQVFNYSTTKEGLNVFYDKQNNPKFLLLNTTPELDESLRKAFAWYDANGIPDAVESLYNNGLSIIMPIYLDSGFALLWEPGVVMPVMYENPDRELLKLADRGVNFFISELWIETFGIAHAQIQTALQMQYQQSPLEVEVIKAYLHSYNAYELYKKYPSMGYRIMSSPFGGDAWVWKYSRFGHATNVDLHFDKLAELIMKANLIDPMGYDDWSAMLDTAALNDRYHLELQWEQYPVALRNASVEFFFCARLLHAIDNAYRTEDTNPAEPEFQAEKLLPRNKIIGYYMNNKGLEIVEEPAILAGENYHREKRPILCLSNLSGNMGKQFRAALKNLAKEQPDIWSRFLDAGLVLFMQNQQYSGEIPRLRFDKGLLLFDCTPAQEKKLGSKGLQGVIQAAICRILGIQSIPNSLKVFILHEEKVINDKVLMMNLLSSNRSIHLSFSLLPSEANQAVTWKSSDESIAIVSNDGIITGIKQGTVTITVMAADNTKATASCKVKITNRQGTVL